MGEQSARDAGDAGESAVAPFVDAGADFVYEIERRDAARAGAGAFSLAGFVDDIARLAPPVFGEKFLRFGIEIPKPRRLGERRIEYQRLRRFVYRHNFSSPERKF